MSTSPLMQGRGLKQYGNIPLCLWLMSPLMQGRGLKHNKWIRHNRKYHVAPHAGAWIETPKIAGINVLLRSPLMQGRGLKLTVIVNFFSAQVAPHAGAWIETWSTNTVLSPNPSPLMQGRGLKQ